MIPITIEIPSDGKCDKCIFLVDMGYFEKCVRFDKFPKFISKKFIRNNNEVEELCFDPFDECENGK